MYILVFSFNRIHGGKQSKNFIVQGTVRLTIKALNFELYRVPVKGSEGVVQCWYSELKETSAVCLSISVCHLVS